MAGKQRRCVHSKVIDSICLGKYMSVHLWRYEIICIFELSIFFNTKFFGQPACQTIIPSGIMNHESFTWDNFRSISFSVQITHADSWRVYFHFLKELGTGKSSERNRFHLAIIALGGKPAHGGVLPRPWPLEMHFRFWKIGEGERKQILWRGQSKKRPKNRPWAFLFFFWSICPNL